MRDRIVGAQAGVDEAWRAVLRARAILAPRDALLDDLLVRLGAAARLDDAAAAASPGVKVLAILFSGKTPSQMGRPTGLGFGRELTDAELALAAFDLLPAGAADAARGLLEELRASVTEGRTAFTALTAAVDAMNLVKRGLPAVKTEAWNTLDRLEGRLKDRFPGESKLVASFFIPRDLGTAKDEEPDEPPAGSPPTA